MKQTRSSLIAGLIHTVCLAAASSGVALSQITVDGVRGGGDTGYTELAVQATTTGWGSNNVLANLHAVQDGANLAVFLGGRPQGNAVLLFIDSKAGGVSFIPNNLITSGGDEYAINNLGSSTSSGLTFETGFQPDYVIRVYGDGGGVDTYVNRYNLQTGARNYVGEAGSVSPVPSGFVSAIRAAWTEITTPYVDVVNGVEMKLNIAALGVPTGTGQPLKLMAILVNGGSDYASNQVLASRTGVTTDIGSGINSINFENETGMQTISLTVDNLDTDGDGIPNDTDPDDDNDNLLDTEENGSGIYVSPTDTGTDPLVVDTDGDGGSDYNEVNSPFTFGFLTDPNIANYATMAVPGSFNSWDVSGASSNSMTRVGTSLADQNKWTLDFKILAPGMIEYKYAANGSYTNSWGNGGGNHTANIPATGIHTFAFDNVSLVQSVTRTVFANSDAFLAAYGVAIDSDDDFDGILAQNEFAANTDPTNYDSDNDGLNDNEDPEPLVPLVQTRDIVFSVNMNVQDALGIFNPESDLVVVDFFNGAAGSLSDLSLEDPDEDGIYTGTLTAFAGNEGSSFGTYKFRMNSPGAPDGGYEGAIGDRTFNLGVKDVDQVLPTVFFNDNSTMPGYLTWAADNAGNQAANLDFDGDGVLNGVEFFMGETGSSFTANPQPVGGVVSWPHSAAATGATFKVWISTDLATWEDKTVDAVDSGGFVSYTLPTMLKVFTRLEVNTQ